MKRVMVVDDEEQIVMALKTFLIAKGYDVFTATDGQSALRTIAEEKPQIVLLDVIMPGMNGINTLMAIRRIDPEIKVIIISALNNRELIKKAIALGADGYINKPFDLNHINNVLISKMNGPTV